MIVPDILADGFFAAIAAVGFGAISDPPMRAFPYIALLAAVGHALRFCLMTYLHVDITTACFFASLTIGMGSLWVGALTYCPMTVFSIPALLPMIPGMYAYKTVFALTMFLQNLKNEGVGAHYMQEMFLNGVVASSAIFTLAAGATLPMFLFSRKAFSLTRRNR